MANKNLTAKEKPFLLLRQTVDIQFVKNKKYDFSENNPHLLQLMFPNMETGKFEKVFPKTENPSFSKLVHFAVLLSYMDERNPFYKSQKNVRVLLVEAAVEAGLLETTKQPSHREPLSEILGDIFGEVTLQGVAGVFVRNFMVYQGNFVLNHNLKWRIASELFYDKAVANFAPDADPNIPKDATTILFSQMAQNEALMLESYKEAMDIEKHYAKLVNALQEGNADTGDGDTDTEKTNSSLL